MITEDYVSFETAKLLKEKGFDEYGMYFYTLEDEGEEGYKSNKRLQELAHNSHPELEKRAVSCPTLQMAMKWLRDTFNLEIYPFHDTIQENNDWWYRIERHSKGCGLTEHESDVIYKTYEEACEAAIKYCLENLI